MKVVHFCPIYIDGWGYQDNLLPLYFKKMGHEVCVISPNILPASFNKTINTNKRYYLDGVEIRRINVFLYLSFTFFITRSLYKNLKELNPDILFHHGVGLTSILVCGFYRLFHPKCNLFVDNHTDEINQAKSKVWLFIYSKIILALVLNIIYPLVVSYYGVTYGRCDYLESVFRINKKKIKLLPIGADTLAVDEITITKEELKRKFNIPINNFTIISGGKMGKDKGTDLLIRSVGELNSEGGNYSLVLFGSYNDEPTQELANNSDFVIGNGWLDRESTLKMLKMSDVAIWPIHHTTLIEDSIACLTPLILRKTRTTEHLIEGNGIFINQPSTNEIKESIRKLVSIDQLYLENSCKIMRDKIDYITIVSLIIEDTL